MIGAIGEHNLVPDLQVQSVQKVDNPFSTFFKAAMDVVSETNQYQLIADAWQTDLATGKTDDILSVLLAQSKAETALNFTVQVTNKIIESYREIMRMAV